MVHLPCRWASAGWTSSPQEEVLVAGRKFFRAPSWESMVGDPKRLTMLIRFQSVIDVGVSL